MRLVQLRANEVKTVNTKFGEKLLIVASGDLKSEIKIWRPLTDPASVGIKPNQFFQAAVDSQGKYSPIASTTDPGVVPTPPAPTPYVQSSPSSPLATITKATEVIEATVVETSRGAYDRHIENLASKIADCYRATKKGSDE
ncbi:MAG: hypothetical protein HC916_15620 [Coleofasciculaceae cyanobacterium SM2_1_6]|nr:hypothetical protein [Coleofasciculaceae cyanobacterium SM2_1_6]